MDTARPKHAKVAVILARFYNSIKVRVRRPNTKLKSGARGASESLRIVLCVGLRARGECAIACVQTENKTVTNCVHRVQFNRAVYVQRCRRQIDRRRQREAFGVWTGTVRRGRISDCRTNEKNKHTAWAERRGQNSRQRNARYKTCPEFGDADACKRSQPAIARLLEQLTFLPSATHTRQNGGRQRRRQSRLGMRDLSTHLHTAPRCDDRKSTTRRRRSDDGDVQQSTAVCVIDVANMLNTKIALTRVWQIGACKSIG